MKIPLLQRLEQRVWQQTDPNRIDCAARLLLAVFRIVTQSRIKLFSTSLTYSSLLAAVPLLAVLFTLLKSFGINKVLPKLLHDALSPMGKAGQEVEQYLIEFISNTQSNLLGGVGLLFLLYTVFSLFRKIEVSLNHIWSISLLRPLKEQIFSYLGALMLVVVVAALAVGLNVISQSSSALAWFSDSDSAAMLLSILTKCLSILVTATLIALIYSVSINTNIKFRAAFSGGLFCALLWLPLTAIFSKTMAASTNYSVIYSTFAGLIILLIWLQILWLLFLSGSLVAYFVQFPKLLTPYGTAQLNPSELEYYAKRIMHIIIEDFKAGKGAVKLSKLMDETHLSHQQVLSILEPFIQSEDILAIGQSGKNYILAKDDTAINDEVILSTIRGKVRSHVARSEAATEENNLPV